MTALSVRQPWAWLIVHGWKDIENREWPTRFRGRVLVHASKTMTADEYDDALELVRAIRHDITGFPGMSEIARGGIVGSVEIFNCVTKSDSPWFFGTYGFALRNPGIMVFRPFRGQLGFFDVPQSIAEAEARDPQSPRGSA